MFSCVWLHFKKCFGKYFLVFGCVLENTIENTFCTCCSHFLIFSRLPNEYIISFIPQNTKKKPKKKKNHQIRTLREIAIGAKARSRSAQSVLRAKRRSLALSQSRRSRSRDRDRRDCDRDHRENVIFSGIYLCF